MSGVGAFGTGAAAARLRHDCAMAWRRLATERGYSLIAIGGLALGLAGCLMIWGYVRYERGYDAWVPGSDRVYQVQTSIRAPGQPEVHTQTSSYIIYDRFPADFPQVEAVTSLAMGKTVTERDGRPEFIDATTVDPSFFRVFPLPFLHGAPATALPDTHAIVLSRSEAVRRFGTPDVLGRTLTLGAGDGRTDYRITGVLADLPHDTNLRLALVMRRDINALPEQRRSWGDFSQQHFVRLRPGADPTTINTALPKWEERVIPVVQLDGKPAKMSDAFDFHLTPLTDVHLGQWQDGATVPGGDPRTLATFGIVALLTLAMATINFVNLSTARAASRAREVALRKMMGATRRQIVVQFLIEGVLVRYAAARPGEVMARLARVWRRFEPEIPFEARFVDDIVREQYAAERARTLLFAGFSALAVVIACLGLYSLAAFTTERRTKEIGIRKVLGATVRHIVQLLAWQFSKPVVLANLIAWPVAWWAMRDWLNGFDARIALGPTPFALAGLLALAIALLTVAGHAVRVARLNPIHALRYE